MSNAEAYWAGPCSGQHMDPDEYSVWLQDQRDAGYLEDDNDEGDD